MINKCLSGGSDKSDKSDRSDKTNHAQLPIADVAQNRITSYIVQTPEAQSITLLPVGVVRTKR